MLVGSEAFSGVSGENPDNVWFRRQNEVAGEQILN
jgi:hypothetical protein